MASILLTLPKIFQIHNYIETRPERGKRGQQYFRGTIFKLKDIIGIGAETEVESFFKQMLNSIGFKAGISENLNLSSEQKTSLSKSANNDRMKNNPGIFNDEQIRSIFNS